MAVCLKPRNPWLPPSARRGAVRGARTLREISFNGTITLGNCSGGRSEGRVRDVPGVRLSTHAGADTRRPVTRSRAYYYNTRTSSTQVRHVPRSTHRYSTLYYCSD